jgi:arabinogalactan oligomer / maltooligosaccharide transport system permease protein
MRWFRDTGWRHLVAVGLLIFALFPVVYVVSASLNPNGTLVGSNQLFGNVSLENYTRLLDTTNYGRWWINSFIVGTATALLTAALCALAAYAFSRFRFRGRRGGLFGLLLVQMFPQLLGYIAIFALLLSFQDYFPAIGLGTLLGLILVYLGGALGVNTWLMKGFFDTVPRDIDESAKVDGAGHARTFFTLILPLVTPIVIVVGMLSYIATTNEYLIARTVLGDNPDVQTLPVGLYEFISTAFEQNWGLFSAGAVLGAVLPTIIFFFAQKYIAGGLLAGAVKG